MHRESPFAGAGRSRRVLMSGASGLAAAPRCARRGPRRQDPVTSPARDGHARRPETANRRDGPAAARDARRSPEVRRRGRAAQEARASPSCATTRARPRSSRGSRRGAGARARRLPRRRRSSARSSRCPSRRRRRPSSTAKAAERSLGNAHRVAFQGAEGAYSHIAARKYFGSAATTFAGFPTFAAALLEAEQRRRRLRVPPDREHDGRIDQRDVRPPPPHGPEDRRRGDPRGAPLPPRPRRARRSRGSGASPRTRRRSRSAGVTSRSCPAPTACLTSTRPSPRAS